MPTLMNLALDLHTTVPGQNTKHNRLLPNDLVLVSKRIFAQTFHMKMSLIYMNIKTESTRSSSNKWTKTLYQDYSHGIAGFHMTSLKFKLPNY